MVKRVKEIQSVKIIRIHMRTLTDNPALIITHLVNELKKMHPIFFYVL